MLGVMAFLVACPDDPEPSRPPLNERLEPGQVRAGQIVDASELLAGPGAKAGVDDFKIYNDRIAVTIGGPRQSPGFHPYGGAIFDADLVRPVGEPSATVFGEIISSLDFSVMQTTSVEVVQDGSSGEARVRARGGLGTLPLYEALLAGIIPPRDLQMEWTIDYVLAPDSNTLVIEHEVFNAGEEDEELSTLVGFFFGTGARPFFDGFGFSSSNSGAASAYFAAASDRVSYLFVEQEAEISVIFGESGIAVSNVGASLKIRARERKTWTQRLVVGDGDLAKTQAHLGIGAGTRVAGRVVDEAGAPIMGAHVHVIDPMRGPSRNYVTRSIANADGRFEFEIASRDFQLVATAADGRASDSVPGADGTLELTLPTVGVAAVSVRDEDGRALPAKLSFSSQTPSPELPGHFGEPVRGEGFERVVFAHEGAIDVALPPGRYTAYVSRGIEYEVAEAPLEITPGSRVSLEVTLTRTVDTPGWMTTDPHIHARLSPDSSDDDMFKVRALAAENIELPVSTDHEAVGDFNPAIDSLGLGEWLHGIVGTEITTTRYGHFNAFPVVADPSKPGRGRIQWYGLDPAGMFAAARAAEGAPVVQVNHPRSTSIGYFELLSFDRNTLTGNADFSLDFDGVEVINECGDGSLDRAEVLDWFALLSAGHKRFATGTMDDHSAGRGRLGIPLTYVAVDAAAPKDVDAEAYRAAFQAGRLSVSCGPFVDAAIDGVGIGGSVDVAGRLDVQATVAAAGWVDVDEVLLIVDGVVRDRAAIDTPDPGVRFNGTLTATVTGEGWAIVWARGDQPHGAWAQGRPSFAFTNPIYWSSP